MAKETPKPQETTPPAVLAPSGDGRVLLVARFPYGEYKSDTGPIIKRTGTYVTAEERDKILAEPGAPVYQIKPKKEDTTDGR